MRAHAYYNEIDPSAAAWLRALIADGQIAPGEVDTRSIVDVDPRDLQGYSQHHFFAGIGGWSYALRLAGWPDEEAVWTGSCPCQPFSAAGKRAGFGDARHLWPAWFRLLAVCRPPVVFGEQVASPAGLGWYDAVHADLEGAGYAVGASDLCAAGVGAPHIRQRIYFVGVVVGDATSRWRPHQRDRARSAGQHVGTLIGAAGGNSNGCGAERGGEVEAGDAGAAGVRAQRVADGVQPARERRAGGLFGEEAPVGRAGEFDGREPHRPADGGEAHRMAHAERDRVEALGPDHADGRNGAYCGREEAHGESGTCGEVRGVVLADRERRHGVDSLLRGGRPDEGGVEAAGGGPVGGVADHDSATRDQGREEFGRGDHRGDAKDGGGSRRNGQLGELADPDGGQSSDRRLQRGGRHRLLAQDTSASFWSDADWIPCLDDKLRPVEPGTFPLAHGVPARVGRLRGYGNAIVPQVAATFILAACDALADFHTSAAV